MVGFDIYSKSYVYTTKNVKHEASSRPKTVGQNIFEPKERECES